MSTENESPGAGAAEKLRGWLRGRLPDDWFEAPPEVIVDREEITVIGRLASPAPAAGAESAA